MSLYKKNIMGSAIQSGFNCKPTIKDPNKPIMFYKSHIIFCMDERCRPSYKNNDRLSELRELIKNLELHKGAKRIKITRSFCFGACRVRGGSLIYNNFKLSNEQVNNCIWLKQSHKLSQDNWINIFNSLANDIPIAKQFNNNLIPIKVYE
jgi:cobalt-precorrin 5A hydrolase